MESTPRNNNILSVLGFSVGGFAACVLAAFLAGFARLATASPGQPDIALPALGNVLCITTAGMLWIGILVSGIVWARKRKLRAAVVSLTVECALAVLCLLTTAILLRDFTFANPP